MHWNNEVIFIIPINLVGIKIEIPNLMARDFSDTIFLGEEIKKAYKSTFCLSKYPRNIDEYGYHH